MNFELVSIINRWCLINPLTHTYLKFEVICATLTLCIIKNSLLIMSGRDLWPAHESCHFFQVPHFSDFITPFHHHHTSAFPSWIILHCATIWQWLTSPSQSYSMTSPYVAIMLLQLPFNCCDFVTRLNEWQLHWVNNSVIERKCN